MITPLHLLLAWLTVNELVLLWLLLTPSRDYED